jgi:hypothetical protein
MSKSVVIHFEPDQDDEYSLIHRLRNFGEDVFRQLRDNGWGEVSLHEVDRATEHFTVRSIKASKLRTLLRWVEQEAARQHLRVTIEVS